LIFEIKGLRYCEGINKKESSIDY